MNDEINKKDRELREKALNWWESLDRAEHISLIKKWLPPGTSLLSVTVRQCVNMYVQEDDHAKIREWVKKVGKYEDPRARVFVNGEYIGNPTTIQKPSWIRRIINYWTRPFEPRAYHHILAMLVIILAVFGALIYINQGKDLSYENPANWDSVWTTMHGKRLVFKMYNPYHKGKLIIKMDDEVVGEGTDSVQEVIHSYYLLPDTTKIVK